MAIIATILLFIDGVGLGDRASYNPWTTHPTPNICQLLSGEPLSKNAVGRHSDSVWLLETDAQLGVDGIPQSATGQATIFTGKNAPQFVGTHMSGFPLKRLRDWVMEDNIYKQFERMGFRATFANNYSDDFFERPTTKRGWISVSTAAILSSGQPLRMVPELLKGKAVFHDITRKALKRYEPDIEEIEPEEAAKHMWSIASEYDLVIHEFFLSDYAGHKQNDELMAWVIHTYDRFLGELIRHRSSQDTIVLVSDHGNSEDLRTPLHTKSLVPTLVVGDVEVIKEFDTTCWDLTMIVPLLTRLVERRKNKTKG